MSRTIFRVDEISEVALKGFNIYTSRRASGVVLEAMRLGNHKKYYKVVVKEDVW